MEKMMMSVDQAVSALSLGRRTVCRLIAEGDIASTKVGTRRLIYVDSVREFLERGRNDRAA